MLGGSHHTDVGSFSLHLDLIYLMLQKHLGRNLMTSLHHMITTGSGGVTTIIVYVTANSANKLLPVFG